MLVVFFHQVLLIFNQTFHFLGPVLIVENELVFLVDHGLEFLFSFFLLFLLLSFLLDLEPFTLYLGELSQFGGEFHVGLGADFLLIVFDGFELVQ